MTTKEFALQVKSVIFYLHIWPKGPPKIVYAEWNKFTHNSHLVDGDDETPEKRLE